jgi:hypothetical protein
MFLLLLGERIFGGEDPMRYGLSGAGLLLTLVALGMVLSKRKAASPEQRPAHSQAVRYGSIGIGSVFLYALTLSGVVDSLGFSDDLTESRYITVTSAIWPIVWLAGTLPFLAVSRCLSVSPLLVMPSGVK